MAYSCLCVCKLILCGDVEQNPGPPVEEMFRQLQNGQSTILEELAAIRSKLVATESTVTALSNRWNELDKKVADICEKNVQIQTLQDKIVSLEQKIGQQAEKMVDFEDRSRRSNLVIYGIDEQGEEDEQILREKVVNNLFGRKLGQTCRSVARIHRLGRRQGNRPVIAYFQDFTEKEAVLRNAKKLKGTSISISNDYSYSTRYRRRLLWQSAKIDKDNGKKVILTHDKLKVDGVLYAWNEAKNDRVVLSPKTFTRDNGGAGSNSEEHSQSSEARQS